ncbi:unnamed protein product [Ambrosiozyma monospora]|uniref:Unnamed protein product n=1 Tax=Ambrosiozyma monospora TaxID=43982 RepID=A0A9W6YZY0_AMBMO|nr:unnamed protein product [Ambrosiozyma monospora]
MIRTSTKLNQHEIIPAKNDVGALGNRINMATRSLHDSINKTVTLKFAIAIREPKVYRQGLQLFYHIFDTIEEALFREMNRDTQYTEMLRNIYKPEVLRKEKLHTDLLFFYNGRADHFEKPILDKQIEFVNHILSVTEQKPYLLLAYLHVMYLALFAGGRIMSSQVTKSLRLFPQVKDLTFEEVVAQGSNFYKFDVEDMETFRVLYKRDYELQTRNFLTEQEKDEVVEEAKYIFKMNGVCVSELEQHNLHIIKSKMSYQVITKGYYVVLVILAIAALYLTKRIVAHLLS